MRALWLLVLVACSKAEAVQEKREAPTPVVVAKQPRHERMAEQVLAAIVAKDATKLPETTKLAREHLGEDVIRGSFERLVAKLEAEQVDVAKLTLERAQAAGRDMIETVDVTLGYQGKRLQFHFNVMASDGYAFMGTSAWFKWVP